MRKVKGYIEDVNKEMRKVNWPDRPELINNTIITILATAAIAMYIYGIDRVISGVLDVIYAFA